MSIQLYPNFLTTEIVVVGAGGTGARLVSKLSQFLVNNRMLPHHRITLVDDDVVEEKNLLRQLFVAPDVGKHKAQVIAQRYNKGFGANIVPIIGRLGKPDAPSKVEAGVTYYASPADIPHLVNAANLVVMICVDKVSARRDIIRGILNSSVVDRCLFFDAGNEATFGQVRVFTNKIGVLRSNNSGYNPQLYMPFSKAGYPEKFSSDSGMNGRDYLNFDLNVRMANFAEHFQAGMIDVDLGEYGKFKPMMPPALPGLNLTLDATIPFNVRVYDVPVPLAHYATLEDSPGESCASLDQTLAVNDMAAGIMFGMFQTYSYGLPLPTKVSYFTMVGKNTSEEFSLRGILSDCVGWNESTEFDELRRGVMHCLRTGGVSAEPPQSRAYRNLPTYLFMDVLPDIASGVQSGFAESVNAMALVPHRPNSIQL